MLKGGNTLVCIKKTSSLFTLGVENVVGGRGSETVEGGSSSGGVSAHVLKVDPFADVRVREGYALDDDVDGVASGTPHGGALEGAIGAREEGEGLEDGVIEDDAVHRAVNAVRQVQLELGFERRGGQVRVEGGRRVREGARGGGSGGGGRGGARRGAGRRCHHALALRHDRARQRRRLRAEEAAWLGDDANVGREEGIGDGSNLGTNGGEGQGTVLQAWEASSDIYQRHFVSIVHCSVEDLSCKL